MEVVWYTSTWHILVVMDDIMNCDWLHQHGKNYWLYIWQCVCTICVNERYGNMVTSSSKKQKNGKLSLNNGILGVDYKMTINILMKHLCIAVWYLYITDWLISGKISRVIYKPTKTMKSDYFTKTIQGKLININKSELTEVNSIKIIG